MGFADGVLGGSTVGDVEGDAMQALPVVGNEVVELRRLAGSGRHAIAGVKGSLGRGHGPRPREEPAMNQICSMFFSKTPFPY